MLLALVVVANLLTAVSLAVSIIALIRSGGGDTYVSELPGQYVDQTPDVEDGYAKRVGFSN